MFDIATEDEDVEVRISASRRLTDPLQIIEALGREEQMPYDRLCPTV